MVLLAALIAIMGGQAIGAVFGAFTVLIASGIKADVLGPLMSENLKKWLADNGRNRNCLTRI